MKIDGICSRGKFFTQNAEAIVKKQTWHKCKIVLGLSNTYGAVADLRGLMGLEPRVANFLRIFLFFRCIPKHKKKIWQNFNGKIAKK